MQSNKPNRSLRHREALADIDVLRSPDYDVIEIAGQHRTVGDALGIDVDWTVRMVKILPLALRADAHKSARKRTARMTAINVAAMKPHLPTMIATHFGRLSEPAKGLDLLNDCIIPFAVSYLKGLSGIAADLEKSHHIIGVFDPAGSRRRRRQIEQAAQHIFETAFAAYPDESLEDIETRVALYTLGRDALIGTLTNSLAAFLEGSNGQPLSQSHFSRVPVKTGVPYVWRQPVGDVDASDRFENYTQAVEIQLDSFEGADDAERMNFFGAGIHSCVGKNMSLALFDAIGAFLATCPSCVTVTDFRNDRTHVLSIPLALTVDVSTLA